MATPPEAEGFVPTHRHADGVWTDGRAQYVANAARPEVIAALEEMIAGWKADMPDIPAHEVN